ncbi:MAG: zinc ribbon domain-containing protein [Candidatus Angelobacter sp.]
MALIQFTRNHTDHSTDKGFQFEFFCDRCGNGFMSEYKASATGMAASALHAAGSFFGGVLGQASSSSYEIERAVRGPAHDKAFRESIEEAKPNFRQCPKCTHWVCQASCWNAKRSLCFDCAPDLDTELASAQVQTTVDQMKQKLQQQDLTKDMDLATEAVALCPACGARTQGAKFCPECGKALHPKNECGKCGTKFEAGTKFCPECGNKIV